MPRTSNRQKVLADMASPSSMFSANSRANPRAEREKTVGYFYGGMGDNIERRYNGFGNSPMAPGQFAHDGMASAPMGGSNNSYGTGLLNGFGRMFSGLNNGLNGGFTYLKHFSSNAAFNHYIIAQCELAYFGYGVVRNIVDLYADFATEGITIEHPDSSVRNFYRTWARKVNLQERCHNIFTNLIISGQVFAHRGWAVLDESEKRSMKRADAKKTICINDKLVIRGKTKDITINGREEAFLDWFIAKKGDPFKKKSKTVAEAPPSPSEENLPENLEKRIPWRYTFLNPLQMEVRGRKIRGDNYWIMAIDKRDTLDVARGMGMRSNVDLGTTEINIPKEFLSRIQAYQGPGGGYFAEVKLTNDELAVIQAPGKMDWFDWAVPFIYPCLRALYFKDCLRTMEIRACESVINSIYLFKLGNIDKGLPATEEHFERLADMLQMPGQTMNIIWNEGIDAEVLQPKIDNIFGTDKHDSADKDILTALGVPEVLLGGKGGNFSNSYIAVATVLERLESYRNQVMTWLMGELKIIADAMGFQKLPTVKFGRTSLQDEKAYQTFLISLYDRNVLSADTLLQEANTDVETESAKMKEENEIREEGVLEMRGPFIKPDNKEGIPQPPPSPVAPAGPGVKKPKTPNGRPPGSSTGPTGEQSKPRAPVGKGIADLLDEQVTLYERGRAMLEQIENFINDKTLKAKARENPNLKNIKQLRLEDRERLENLIYNVFSHMAAPVDDNPLQDDFIIHALRSDAAESVKADVFAIYTNKIAEYSKTYGKMPTRQLRRQFMTSSWTQRAILKNLE